MNPLQKAKATEMPIVVVVVTDDDNGNVDNDDG